MFCCFKYSSTSCIPDHRKFINSCFLIFFFCELLCLELSVSVCFVVWVFHIMAPPDGTSSHICLDFNCVCYVLSLVVILLSDSISFSFCFSQTLANCANQWILVCLLYATSCLALVLALVIELLTWQQRHNLVSKMFSIKTENCKEFSGFKKTKYLNLKCVFILGDIYLISKCLSSRRPHWMYLLSHHSASLSL
jgi:hypothetical protein